MVTEAGPEEEEEEEEAIELLDFLKNAKLLFYC